MVFYVKCRILLISHIISVSVDAKVEVFSSVCSVSVASMERRRDRLYQVSSDGTLWFGAASKVGKHGREGGSDPYQIAKMFHRRNDACLSILYFHIF